MIITQPLQYIAPDCAPFGAMWFGTSPSGIMQVTRVAGCLKMDFIIPSAQQRVFHPHPNTGHHHKYHIALLPDSQEGRNMLFRFQVAFLKGLCFEVDQFANVNWTRLFPFPPMGLPSPQHMLEYSAVMNHFSIPNDPQVCYQSIMANQSYVGASPILSSFSTGAPTSTYIDQLTHALSSLPWTTPPFQYDTSSSYASSYVTSTAPPVTASSANPPSSGTSAGHSTASSSISTHGGFSFGSVNPPSSGTSAGHSTATASSSRSTHGGFTFGSVNPSSSGTSTGHSTATASSSRSTHGGFTFGSVNPSSSGTSTGHSTATASSSRSTHGGFTFGSASPSSSGTSAGHSTASSSRSTHGGFTFGSNPPSSGTSTGHSTATASSSRSAPGFSFGSVNPPSSGTSAEHSPTALSSSVTSGTHSKMDAREVIYFSASRARSSASKRRAMLLDPVLSCREGEKEEECSICLENMVPTSNIETTNVVCIKACRHRFHKHCMMQLFEQKHENCPYCRVPMGLETFGEGPSGNMTIIVDNEKRCNGFEDNSDGIIVIIYTIPKGTQHAGMVNPGRNYSGTQRIAYLPHNKAGRELLVRLKYAFTHGLTFRVGTSISTGRSNQVIWGSIPHKTNLGRGAFGFPDSHYLFDCNESLDYLKVPKAKDCL